MARALLGPFGMMLEQQSVLVPGMGSSMEQAAVGWLACVYVRMMLVSLVLCRVMIQSDMHL